ncbi:MAG: hypothetical protein KAH18_01730 [Psychromonas sp.]|nr:hypothetical protein [Psychromonas sp.]
MSYLFELMSQRKQFSNGFCSFKQNMDDNSNRLLACARLLRADPDHFFSKKNPLLALDLFKVYEELSNNQQLLLLQVYAKIHNNFTSLLSNLQESPDPKMQLLGDELMLIKGNKGLLKKFSGTSNRLQIQLLYCFYTDQYENVLKLVESEDWEATPVNKLYFNLLFSDTQLQSDLLLLFIDLELLESHLFELFIVALNEKTVTEVVNKLSADDEHVKLIIRVMSLSGYTKFIPFLARYLQDEKYTLCAYHSLRILLGDKLDELIPSDIQFDSDQEKQKSNLAYYGAKMLHYWDSDFLKVFGPCILSGKNRTPLNILNIYKSASQAHRRVASINQIMVNVDDGLHYYAEAEAIL